MRIAFLDSWSREPSRGSGTAVSIASLARALEDEGHQVIRVPGRAALERYPDAPSLPRRIGYNRSLPRRLRELGPDLAVGFDLDGFLLPASRPYPLVVQLKGVAADEARFERGAPRWKLRTVAHLEARNARKADRVVVPSEYSRRRAVELYDLDPARVYVVPEAVEAERWSGENRDPDVGPVVLSVARQYPRKNTRTLVRAMDRVGEAVPAARLRVVGGGPELPALRRQVRSEGLEDRVDLPGSVPGRDALREEYHRARCFCLPSLQEGFGIAFLEAMAAGLPVVAGDAGAVPEVVRDGETGLLVDPRDPAAVARAVVRVLEDPELARSLGDAGVRRARTYSPRRSARAFLRAVGFARARAGTP